MSQRRTAISIAVFAAASLATAAGLALLYLRVEVLTPSRFADRAADTVRVDSVRTAIGESLTQDLIERAHPGLIVARPLIESVVAGVVGSDSFRPIVHAAASQLYRGLDSGQGGQLILGLSDTAVVAIEALRQFQPEIAELIPPEAEKAAAELGSRGLSADALSRADELRPLGLLVPGLAVVFLVVGVVVAPSRRRAAGWAGLAVLFGGVLVATGLPLGRAVAGARAPDGRGDVVRSVWDAFLDDLSGWALLVAAAGLVIWLTARGRLRADELAAAVREGLEWATAGPRGTRDALMRGGTLLALALVIALAWRSVVQIAVLGVAVLVAIQGLGLLLHALAPGAPRPAAPAPEDGRALERMRRALPGVIVTGTALVAVVGVALGVRGGGGYGPDRVVACNGSGSLCERPVNEVVFAATHNSMAAADEPGWFRAAQTGGIAAQLRFGIRGLLIDTWYGTPGPRGVATDFARSGVDRAELVRAHGREAVAAVERLRGRLGFGSRADGPDAGIYLCHVACEAGATGFESALGEIRSFLQRNPGEVLILVVQDQVSPQDTRRAILRSGLREHVLTPPSDGAWPTLGQMLETGQRVIVMSENRTSPDIPWLLPAFELMEETPYDFRSAAEMSCRPNRGGTGRVFFQLNHWIERPLPSPADAERVNAFAFLMERVRRCQRERGRLPNLVAVNFYERGDLLRVVDELNGAASRS